MTESQNINVYFTCIYTCHGEIRLTCHLIIELGGVNLLLGYWNMFAVKHIQKAFYLSDDNNICLL